MSQDKDNKLVEINLHGDLGRGVKVKQWHLAVKSVREAISAIDTLTNNGFSNYFIHNNKLFAKYRVLINKKDFMSPVKEINLSNYHEVHNSELVMEKNNLETIDIIPVLEGAGKVFADILAGLAIIVGVILLFFPGTQAIGVVLIAGGVAYFLSKPPKSSDFRKIDKSGSESYLFTGPVNVVGEGGPVPVGYGTALVGSQVISASYFIEDYQVAF